MKKIALNLIVFSTLTIAKNSDHKSHSAEHMLVRNYPSGHMLQVSAEAAQITLELLEDLLKQVSKTVHPGTDYMPHLTATSVEINENLRESLEFATDLLASIKSANGMVSKPND